MKEYIRRFILLIKSALVTFVLHGVLLAALLAGLWWPFSESEVTPVSVEPIQAQAVSTEVIDKLAAAKKQREDEKQRIADTLEELKQNQKEEKKQREKLEAEKKQQEIDHAKEKLRIEKAAEKKLVTEKEQQKVELDREKLRIEKETEKKLDAEKKRLAEENEKKLELEKERLVKENEEKLEAEKKRREQEKIEIEKARVAEQKRRDIERLRVEAENQQKQEDLVKKLAADEIQREQALVQRLAEEAQLRERDETKREAASAMSALAGRIQAAIKSNWRRPLVSAKGLEVTIRVKMLRQGQVASGNVVKTSGDKSFDDSALLAIKKASPLPFPTNPKYYEFINTFELKFNPDD